MEDEFYEEEDIYTEKGAEAALENDEIEASEFGFISGFLRINEED